MTPRWPPTALRAILPLMRCPRAPYSRLAALLTVLLLFPGTPARAGDGVSVSPLDPEFDLLLELRRRGHHPTLAASAPSRLDQIASPGTLAHDLTQQARTWAHTPADTNLGIHLRPYLSTIALTTDPPRQLRPLFLDVRKGRTVDPTWRLRAGTYLDARFHPNITAHLRFAFDSEGANETLNRTRDFQQLEASNNFDEAYLQAEFESARLRVGRFAQRWGPERLGSLILGATAPAPDMIHGSLDWGPHHLQTFVGQLSAETDSTGTYRRWLYGHRADLFFFDRDLRVGVSELAVVSGRSESLDLRYLNPVSLWAQVQVEDDEEDATEVNVLNAVDAELRRDGLRLYGSLVVDDFQIDSEGREENPDQLAWSAGLDWSPHDHPRWLVGYEYRRIGSWTYLRRHPGTDFRQFRRPLAAPEGPDTDRHNLRLDWRRSADLLFWLEGERRRRGTNRLSTEDSRLGQAGRPFPLGTVEKRWILAAGATLTRAPFAHLEVELAYHSITDRNNRPGDDEDLLELRALLHLRAPSWGFGDEGP